MRLSIHQTGARTTCLAQRLGVVYLGKHMPQGLSLNIFSAVSVRLPLVSTPAAAAAAAPLLQVPPSGAFSWRPQSVLVKETGAKMDGWQLAGMVQFDALGRPAFLHR